MSGAALGSGSLGILFRCDGSGLIGMGHVVRCTALALALKERDCRARVVMRDLPGSAGDFVGRAGVSVEVIAHPSSAEETWLSERDLDGTVEAARRWRAGVVVVDHYGASSDYLGRMKARGVRVAVIDDLADRDLAPADWLLNQNLGTAGLAYRVRPDCVRLLGPAFALLRPEFGVTRRHSSKSFRTGDRRVLITLGGGDTAQLCAEVLSVLQSVPRRLHLRCVVLGEDAVPAGLTEAVGHSPHEVEILNEPGSMAELMVWADLSINGSGSTCWELCCLGVPMLVLVLAPNQERNAAELEQRGCALSLGAWRPESGARLAGAVENLLADAGRRAAMSRVGRALVDGAGPARAADSLIALVGG